MRIAGPIDTGSYDEALTIDEINQDVPMRADVPMQDESIIASFHIASHYRQHGLQSSQR